MPKHIYITHSEHSYLCERGIERERGKEIACRASNFQPQRLYLCCWCSCCCLFFFLLLSIATSLLHLIAVHSTVRHGTNMRRLNTHTLRIIHSFAFFLSFPHQNIILYYTHIKCVFVCARVMFHRMCVYFPRWWRRIANTLIHNIHQTGIHTHTHPSSHH